MGKYIELNCSNASKREYKSLVKAIGDNPYGIIDDSVVIPLAHWNRAKEQVLRQSGKYKAVRYGLVEVLKGQSTQLIECSEIFSDEFLEMERSLADYK